MTTGGEGGMVTTNDRDLWKRIWSYKDHGKSWEAVYERDPPAGFRWLHKSFGTNWRMIEAQAAIGRIQLRRMSEWHASRLERAQTIWNYARRLRGLRVPEIPPGVEHAAYKCSLFVEPDQLRSGWNRDRVMAEINLIGVPCQSGSCPEIYLEKAFAGTEWLPPERLPVARELGKTSLMFLVHPTLKHDAVGKTCEVLEKVMARARN